jgi:hypothetical protein
VGTISISCRRHSGVDGNGVGGDFTDMQEGWFCKVGEVPVTCIDFQPSDWLDSNPPQDPLNLTLNRLKSIIFNYILIR